jgi:glycosyl-4,4'-diaponeurosporenoate acyltransferase
MNYLTMLVTNVLVIAVWHGTTLLMSTHLPNSYFQPTSAQFQPWKWEKGGRWYRDHLHINDWKDRVPQFISQGGFSKRHLTNLSPEYLGTFIVETCRGEWTHTWNLGCVFVVLLMNQSIVGITFSILIFMGNGPCAVIQRYNRFRLVALRDRLQRETARIPAAT